MIDALLPRQSTSLLDADLVAGDSDHPRRLSSSTTQLSSVKRDSGG